MDTDRLNGAGARNIEAETDRGGGVFGAVGRVAVVGHVLPAAALELKKKGSRKEQLTGRVSAANVGTHLCSRKRTAFSMSMMAKGSLS